MSEQAPVGQESWELSAFPRGGAGEPALERTLPPQGEPDFARLDAAAAKAGIEHLPPPPG
ncbi:MAG TPA: hypothetical protein VD859_10990 [Nocardioides sp.]|nr:hypothetical protein [Nocardioides sp.]